MCVGRLLLITWPSFLEPADPLAPEVYNNTGRSVFIAVLFHATINVTYFLFPVQGSFYDPRMTSLMVALIAVIITVASGPQTLIRGRAVQGSAAREGLPPAR